jgi:hypothetical protein
VSDGHWRRISEIVDAVVSAPLADRQRILLEQCAGDALLESEVASLLKAHESRAFLEESSGWQVRPGDILCDRFVVTRAIGQGGMGDVWAAGDRQLGEEIAIKTIRASAVPTAGQVDRFKREIQLARRIAHPNVCRVYELFEDRTGPEPRLFLTMELVEGETLAERLRRQGAIPIDEAMSMIEQVVAGLAAAHAVNVVHRDLRPSNVMLTPRAERRVVLMDSVPAVHRCTGAQSRDLSRARHTRARPGSDADRGRVGLLPPAIGRRRLRHGHPRTGAAQLRRRSAAAETVRAIGLACGSAVSSAGAGAWPLPPSIRGMPPWRCVRRDSWRYGLIMRKRPRRWIARKPCSGSAPISKVCVRRWCCAVHTRRPTTIWRPRQKRSRRHGRWPQACQTSASRSASGCKWRSSTESAATLRPLNA